MATAVPASLICSSGFWGSQVMNRQHLLTSGGRWVFSLIGDTFFRINSKIAQTGSLWLWAAAIATEFGWAGYRYVTGLVGQREGPPHGVGQLLKGVGRVLKTEFTADERPIGENASGVVTLVHPSAVTAPDELVTNQLGQLDLRREQRPSAVTATGEKPVAIIALADRDQAFKRAVADQLSRELRENALYNLGIEGVAGGGTPGRLSAGPQKAVDLVAQLEKGLSPEEQSVRDAWRRELTPKGNQPTWRASARDRFRKAMTWVTSRRPAGIAPAMATATAH
ncbi:MAG: hypothetical protein IPG96_02125 [Proteobacteria bacterium]|nr:hypothetical protein [Pseudomonadota bacterium]